LYLREIAKFACEIPGPPLPADFVVFRFGRTFSHGAIVLEWPLIIHSYIPHGVALADALGESAIIGRETKMFAVDLDKCHGSSLLRFKNQHHRNEI
jgi:hypothetical protein